MILQIALDTPLRRVFDYRPPAELVAEARRQPALGVRVRVPFGRRQLIGILVGIASRSAVPPRSSSRHSTSWTSNPSSTRSPSICCAGRPSTTTTPSGEVFAAALPASLRAGQPA